MKAELLRPGVLRVTLGAYEMATLMAAVRWALEGREGDPTPESLQQLQQVLDSYVEEVERLQAGRVRSRHSFANKEEVMARRYIDCREVPSDMNCTVAISADTEDELLEAAVQHGVEVHGHEDTPEFRTRLRAAMKTGAPARDGT